MRGSIFMRYSPEVAPWQFRSHRLRRLHRKLCQIDNRVAFVGGINVIDDANTPGQTPPRADFAVMVEGPLLVPIVQTMQRVWALVQLVRSGNSDVAVFPGPDLERARRIADREVRHARQSPPSSRHRARVPRGDPDGEARDHHRQFVLLPGDPLSAGAAGRGRARRRGDAPAAGASGVHASALRDPCALRPASQCGYSHPGVSPQHAARQGRGRRRPLGDGRLLEHRSLQPVDGARGKRVRPRQSLQSRPEGTTARDGQGGIAARRSRRLGEPAKRSTRPRSGYRMASCAWRWASWATAATSGFARKTDAKAGTRLLVK